MTRKDIGDLLRLCERVTSGPPITAEQAEANALFIAEAREMFPLVLRALANAVDKIASEGCGTQDEALDDLIAGRI